MSILKTLRSSAWFFSVFLAVQGGLSAAGPEPVVMTGPKRGGVFRGIFSNPFSKAGAKPSVAETHSKILKPAVGKLTSEMNRDIVEKSPVREPSFASEDAVVPFSAGVDDVGPDPLEQELPSGKNGKLQVADWAVSDMEDSFVQNDASTTEPVKSVDEILGRPALIKQSNLTELGRTVGVVNKQNSPPVDMPDPFSTMDVAAYEANAADRQNNNQVPDFQPPKNRGGRTTIQVTGNDTEGK